MLINNLKICIGPVRFKTIDGYANTFWGFVPQRLLDHKNNVKSWWSSVQYLLRYLVWYVDFYRFLPKGTETPCMIVGVSGPIFTKIAQNVAKIVPVNTSKSELRYSNPLRNANVLNKGHFANFAQNRLPWQRPLRNQKRGPDRENSRKYLSFGEKIAKIGPADPEIICLKLKKKKLRKVKYIARSASLLSGLNDW